MEYIGIFFRILGSLGLFLYGMKVMSDGIQQTAGSRLQAVLGFITGNRFVAVFTGFVVTAIIQSSSATTVMVVSFVNAGLLTLTQSIGIIMGANIGTTVTAWIVSLVGFTLNL
ncbi:MAG: Na/Pi symporter, partial [Treponema sp.]|nr:Na/Pi symporter [Treponema sp.]